MILKLAALGALGYFGYRTYEKERAKQNGVAFANGEPRGFFRNAGSASTRSHDPMDDMDEALDETYPASDAVAKY